MAAVSWKSAVSANWTIAADWSTGAIPGAADDVTIGVGGSYTVLLTTPVTVHSITVSDVNATLAIDDPSKTETVSGNLVNSGAVDVDTNGYGGTTVNIGGTLTNSGTLTIGSTSSSGGSLSATVMTAAGLVNTGAIVLEGPFSTVLDINAAAPATLTGTVDLHGNSRLEFASGGITAIASGATLLEDSGAALVALASNTSTNSALTGLASNAGYLILENSAALAISVNFTNSDYLEVDYSGAGGSSLTIGGTLTNNGQLYIGNASQIADAAVTAQGLSNAGTIDITSGGAGATLAVAGAFANTGTVIDGYGSGGAGSLTAGTLTNAGYLYLENGAALTTNLDLTNNYVLEVDESGSGGSSLTVGGTLTNKNYYFYVGNSSMTAAATVSAAALSNSGSLYLYSGTAAAALDTTGAFGNTGAVYIDNSGAGGSTVTVGGVLTNNGTLSIGNTSQTKATKVTAAGLAGTGTVDLSGGATAAAQATLDVTGAAPATLNGAYSLVGNALLEFGSGGVSAIGSGASLTLNGPKALVALSSGLTSNSALSGLASNAGTVILENGAALATTVALDNTGIAYVDYYYGSTGGSSLTVGGALTNEDGLYIGYYGNNAATTTVSAAALSNFGTLYLYSNTAAATLKVAGAFSNGRNDIVYVDNSGAGGSTVTVGGVLTNNGTLSIGNTSQTKATKVTAAGLAGTGTVDLSGGATAAAQATLDVTGAAPATLNGAYSLVGNALLEFGSGGVSAIGSGASLTLNGPKALVALSSGLTSNSALSGLASNAGTVILENGAALATTVALDNTGIAYVDYYYGSTGGSSLTVGGALTNEDGLYIGYYGNNAATTTVSAAALSNFGTLYLYSNTAAATLKVAGAFSNGRNDIVYVDNSGAGGSTVTVGGVLTNNGTLSIGNTSQTKATKVTAAGLAGTGTVDLSGGATAAAQATLDVTGAAPATLNGAYSLVGNALLEFGSGGVSAIGSGASLTLNGPKALVALSSGLTSNSALSGLASNAGTVILENGAALATTVALDNTGIAYVDYYYGSTGGSSLTVGGALTNEDGLYIGYYGNNAATTTVSAAALSNFGTLYLYSNTAAATLKVAGAFSNGRNDIVYVDNSGAGGSTVTVGGVLTNNGTLSIGNTSQTKATKVTAAGLAGTGTVDLSGGATAAAQATLDVTGAAPATLNGAYSLVGNALLEFGSGGVSAIGSGASLTLNGPKALVALSSGLTSNSALSGLASNAGTVILENGAALATTVALDNTGIAYVDYYYGSTGGSSLTVGGALTNEDGLYIGYYGNNAATTTVSAAALSNFGTLYLYSNTAAATLKVAGAFSNGRNDIVYVDNSGAGGSTVTVGGVLTNNGTLSIGNTSQTKATKVTAAGLAGTGTVDLSGGATAAAQATLDVTGAAPATLNGAYSLVGNALLEFGSGGVSAIGSGASLTLNGPKALVALSSGLTSNSALSGLASNAGTVILENGAALATTVALDNTGIAYVDYYYGSTGGSSLTVGGALTNEASGHLYVGTSGSAQSTTVTAASLNNSGYVDLTGGSGTNTGKLSLGGASSDSGQMYIYGGDVLALGSTLTVTGSLWLYGGTISGGTLAGAGTIEVAAAPTSTLTNVAIAAGTTVTAAAGSTLTDNGVTVNGSLYGSGSATLNFAKAGNDSLANISGFTTIGLANGAANTLTLQAINFTGVAGGEITVNDGNSGNTVSGSSLTSADAIVVHAGSGADILTGGAGNDVFYAGGDTTMTGNAGANQFVFSAPGASNTIVDFAASSTNELVFSNSGFSLGQSGASATPQALPTTLFASNSTGAFGTTAQRFAYDTANGQLLYDAQGSASGSTPQLVATLTGHPAISAATQLFFVS